MKFSDSQILLQNLLSQNYWWKNTLPRSKVLICYGKNFHQQIILKFEDEVSSHFLFL